MPEKQAAAVVSCPGGQQPPRRARRGWGPPRTSVWLRSRVVAGGDGAPHSASCHPGHSGLGTGKQKKEGFCAGMQLPPQPPQGPGWRGVMPTPPGGSGGCSGIAQQHSAPPDAAGNQPRGTSWHKEATGATTLFICSEERCAQFIQDPAVLTGHGP